MSVGPQVFDLLLHLVGTRDRVVSKDELLQAVWGGRIVSESTINQPHQCGSQSRGDTGGGAAPDPDGRPQGLPLRRRHQGRGIAEVRQPVGAGVALEAPADRRNALRARPSGQTLHHRPALSESQRRSGAGIFADGIVEDIITALSRIRCCSSIARNSRL